MMMNKTGRPLDREAFEQALRGLGRFYHIHHPYHVMMYQGRASVEQIRGWVLNRYYYQISIPIKDANVLANCPDPLVRREWIQRILDHDGHGKTAGGIEAWTQLALACGIDKVELTSLKHVLPGVRFAVDAYVNFARNHTWQEAACSSLTELFAPEIHNSRLKSWPEHYPWIDKQGLAYFRNRLSQARRDVEHGLAITLDHFKSVQHQEKALGILYFKLEVLWSMLDAMDMAYVQKKPPFYNCEHE